MNKRQTKIRYRYTLTNTVGSDNVIKNVVLQIVVHKQLLRVGIKLATFGLLEKRLDLSPREVRYF